ncbi:hypothetical protein EVJ58_g7006 [Rhodofomes roseus]|uniref:Uncharacterized protein n=1 Tax=Rhodofomes roseus TaxID=34475 RepID=A0A4Y9Y519_9APHY|nr:hypothetical protein EVJ58_g7006 [Rhodofomes roseus]
MDSDLPGGLALDLPNVDISMTDGQEIIGNLEGDDDDDDGNVAEEAKSTEKDAAVEDAIIEDEDEVVPQSA